MQSDVAQLTRERDEALEREKATAEVLRVISSSSTDVQAVFDTIVRSAVLLCGAMHGSAVRFDGELMHLVAGYNYTPEVDRVLREAFPMRPSSRMMSGRAILSRDVVQVRDALDDPDYPKDVWQAGGFRSMLAAPMLRDGRPIGAIVVNRGQPGPFSPTHIQLLRAFADQAVIAIENVRLFDEAQARTRELSEALEQQTATSEVLRVISTSPGELEPVFQAILENATRLCGGNFAALWQYDGAALVGAAQHNVSPGFAELCRNTKLRLGPEGAARKAALERRTIHVPDITIEPGFSPVVLQHEKARTVLAVPLLREKDLRGVICIWRREVQPFSEQQIALVRTFADQAAIAIENARLLNELRESLQQQTATADVLKVISRSAFNLQSVLATLVGSAARLCGADHALLFRRMAKPVISPPITVAPPSSKIPSSSTPFRSIGDRWSDEPCLRDGSPYSRRAERSGIHHGRTYQA